MWLENVEDAMVLNVKPPGDERQDNESSKLVLVFLFFGDALPAPRDVQSAEEEVYK
jgi:hypothetical protein